MALPLPFINGRVCILCSFLALADARGVAYLEDTINKQPLNGLNQCVIYRHKNTQEARQVGILGAERRAPPLVRLSPAVLSLLACIAQDLGLQDAFSEVLGRRRR